MKQGRDPYRPTGKLQNELSQGRTEKASGRGASIRYLLTLAALVLAVTLGSNVAVQAKLSKPLIKNLETLEKKFFEHTYEKDDSEKRIERIEKLVFGEAKSGNQAQRLSSLMATLPQEPPEKKQSPVSTSKSGLKAERPKTDRSASTEDTSTEYPRVDAIEQVVLGRRYHGEPLSQRLDQLEIKAFGHASKESDLSKRVSHLEKYVSKHYHKSITAMMDPRNQLDYSSVGAAQSNFRAPAYSGSGSYGMNPPAVTRRAPSRYGPEAPPPVTASIPTQVTWLENHVFGHSYPQLPLIERVRKLESTVFPSEPPDRNASIPAQVKVLVNAVELSHRSAGRQPATNQPTQASSWPGQYSNQSLGGYAAQSTARGYGGRTGYGYGANNGYRSSSSYGSSGGAFPSGYSNSSSGYSNTGFGATTGIAGSGTQNSFPSQLYPSTSQLDSSQTSYQQPRRRRHGHPLLKGLARSLLTVGSMAGRSLMYGGGGYGRGGYFY